MIGGYFSDINSTHSTATAYFNGQPYHTAGITISMLDNALLRYFTNSDDNEIVTINHPLPNNVEVELQEDLTSNFILTFIVSITMMFGNYISYLFNTKNWILMNEFFIVQRC